MKSHKLSDFRKPMSGQYPRTQFRVIRSFASMTKADHYRLIVSVTSKAAR